MMMKLNILLVCFFTALVSTNAFAVGDIEAGKASAAVCAACHGQNGISSNPMWPKLAGQHAYYIEKELHDFRSKKRNDPTMAPMVAGLTDVDIENLAAYFASVPSTVEAASADKIKLGEKIYRAGKVDNGLPACIACHGPNGAGSAPARFPRIGGQHAAYLSKALKDFKAETRNNDHQAMMRDIAGRMNNKEIEAVSSYISGLH
ncbi:MAG: cytochrome c553 [Cycloclasticus pugetii]|jgi:cytochrome c553|uniref:Cytochrome c, class I n=3 Tax=Cycloclasticus TaxID=34067 RepID=S5TBA0_9GAMM|nr:MULTISPECIES: c-type cytochrome [Cycloclasticus]AFT66242.1 Cytochrome c, class I [Cycloclasticus sp. P1]AGS40794.1 Cytochrome c, class I [Cycloclasticus zancles 78-ME]MDF1829464.1 c-type cytochrome [Cycloclasticus pugetii]|tara:strand:+ start:114 stop:725 length:612 start_codon:yes stop_codon:yes gene_type:complete